MKLLTKNTILLLVLTSLVFFVGGFIFYFQLRVIMDEEASESLHYKKSEIEKSIFENNTLPKSIFTENQLTFTRSEKKVKEEIKSVFIYMKDEDEQLPFLQLTFNVNYKNENYVCSISKSLMESDDLVETIFTSLALIIISLILIVIVINYVFSKKIWKPFFKTLDIIKNYEVEKHQIIQLEKFKTKEFQQLNDAIHKMTQKIANDFNNLKAFTENASHELQTPLAIIKSKTEVLLQSENLDDETTKQLLEINQTTSRISKLNQTLLLLSKIENNQFKNNEEINFSEIIENKLVQFEDLLTIKSLVVSKSIQKISIALHPILAEILVSNLFSNAIRYTPENGTINLELTTTYLKISNSGNALKASENLLFTRFYKENASSESTGLGLAIVKQIAVINKHNVNYEYKNNLHCFSYYF